ncbi:uncharacterized protein LOC115991402 [Quercus lobata]|uniref:uncharacterized protein LOC115991402 n=1 Tax=Quercus lobata TaxID=97700 RepID=UPI001247F67C|nr:uncharacterized protein LOC115991402 [Quercus lobata]
MSLALLNKTSVDGTHNGLARRIKNGDGKVAKDPCDSLSKDELITSRCILIDIEDSSDELSIIGDAVGSMLAQEDDEKNERVIYYLTKRFHDYETRYTPIEKSCFVLVLVVQRLRHVVLPFQIWVVARLSRWLILLAKFDLKYVARKTIKGSIVSDFCAKNPIKGENGKEDFLDEDILDVEFGTRKMYFDGAVNQYGNGVGVLSITPEGSHIPLAIKLNFEVTNNMAEYKACIVGMEALENLG